MSLMSLSYQAKKLVNDALGVFGIRMIRTADWWAKEKSEAFLYTGVARERVFALAELLRLHTAVGVEKTLLGSEYDGGYVCLDDFNGVSDAFSIGIADNDEWGDAAAARGLSVHQFDHTIESPPHAYDFHKSKLVPLKKGKNEEDISSLLSYAGKGSAPLLKMDIEGDEWAAFAKAPQDALRRFSQISMELHLTSTRLLDPWYQETLLALQKLSEDFAVVHVRSNYCGGWNIFGYIPFPGFLEVTFANRSRYTLVASDELYPTSENSPNLPELCNALLRCFTELPQGRFHPPKTDT
jgi:hypothetical protein